MFERWIKACAAGFWTLALGWMLTAPPAAAQLQMTQFTSEEESGNGLVEAGEDVIVGVGLANAGGPPGGRTARLEATYPPGFGGFRLVAGKLPDTFVETDQGFEATWHLDPDEATNLVYRITAPGCFAWNQSDATHNGRLFDGTTLVDVFQAGPIPIAGASAFLLSIDQSTSLAQTAPGETIPWTLSVRNGLVYRQARVVVRDAVPPWTSFESASPEFGGCTQEPCSTEALILDCSETRELDFTVRVDDTLPAGVDEICNVAEVLNSGFVRDTSTSCVPIDPDELFFDLAATLVAVTTQAAPGDPAIFQVGAVNLGTVPAQGVRLQTTVPPGTTFRGQGSAPGWSCTDGDPAGTPCVFNVGGLPGGSSGSWPFALTVLDPLPGGVDAIRASVDVQPLAGDADPSNNGSQAEIPIDPASLFVDLIASKSTASEPPGAGDPVVFTVGALNAGNTTAGGVAFEETVPVGTSFDASLSSPGWTCADGSPSGTACTLTVGTLDGGGQNAERTFAVRVLDPLPGGVDRIVNQVTVQPLAGDADPSNNGSQAEIPIDPTSLFVDLIASKSTASDPPGPGDPVIFTVGALNAGNTTATDVIFEETVPAGTSFNASASSPGWSCADGSPSGTACTLTVGTLDGGGQNAERTFAVRVLDPLPGGVDRIVNQVTVQPLAGDANPADNTTTSEIPIDPTLLFVDLIASKSTESDPPGPGDPVVFTLGVLNAGNTTATDVIFEETVPSGTSFDASASSPGWSCLDGSPSGTACTLTVGTLDGGGQSAERVFAVRVLDALPGDVDRIVNRVTVQPESVDANPADNTAEAEVSIVLGPGDGPNLVLQKSADRTTVGAGERIRWAVSVTNAGNVGAGPVVLEDSVPEQTVVAEGSSPEWLDCPPGATAGTACRIELAGLAVGQSRDFVLACDVVSPLPAGVDGITNTVTGSTDGETDPTDDQASVIVSISVDDGHGPDVALGLTSDRDEVAEGRLLVFTLTAESRGDQGAEAVSLSAEIPAWTSFVADRSDPGWICGELACALDVGALESGNSVAAAFAVEVGIELPPEVTEIVGRARVSAALDVDPSDDAAELAVPVVVVEEPEGPDLRLSLEGTEEVVPGDGGADRGFYAATVVHQSGEPAPGVTVELVVPTPVDLERFEADGEGAEAHCGSSELGLVCRLPPRDLSVGDTVEVELQVRFPADTPEGVVTVEASAFPDPPELEVEPADNRALIPTRVTSEGTEPDPVDVPTVSSLGLLGLAWLLGLAAVARLRRRHG